MFRSANDVGGLGNPNRIIKLELPRPTTVNPITVLTLLNIAAVERSQISSKTLATRNPLH